ncbi:hypothetical protein F5X99DRAFT_188113 [Biscogniauxia marginata]|nr:hypothetical protein F5X99DRAFT_188113 [Biscogniauxia marginata]
MSIQKDIILTKSSLSSKSTTIYVRDSTAMSILTRIGIFVILRGLHELVWFLWAHFWRTSDIESYLQTKDGKASWAMVTNASDAIGEGFADKLASLGFNVVLHDRDPYMLSRTRARLERKYPKNTFRTSIMNWQLPVDGAHTSFSEIKATVEDINLKVLINNPINDAPNTYGSMDRNSPKQLADMITSLAVFHIQISSVLIRQLARNGPSLVINVVPTANTGVPTHASSRALLMRSTVELSLEDRVMRREVEVLGLKAGNVALNTEGSIFCPSVERFVEAALAKVGCGRVLVIPYWAHVIQSWAARLVPEAVSEILQVELMSRRYRKHK